MRLKNTAFMSALQYAVDPSWVHSAYRPVSAGIGFGTAATLRGIGQAVQTMDGLIALPPCTKTDVLNKVTEPRPSSWLYGADRKSEKKPIR